jgi:predicted RecA/RadA family phage recombinase
MQNLVQSGAMITVTAPTGGITSGQGFLEGHLFGVAATTQADGANVEIATTGVFDLPKTSGQTYAVGAPLYWDATNKRLTSTATNNRRIGVAITAAGGSAATARVRLDGAAT